MYIPEPRLCPVSAEVRNIRSPQTGVIDGCESSCGFWGSNLSPERADSVFNCCSVLICLTPTSYPFISSVSCSPGWPQTQLHSWGWPWTSGFYLLSARVIGMSHHTRLTGCRGLAAERDWCRLRTHQLSYILRLELSLIVVHDHNPKT